MPFLDWTKKNIKLSRQVHSELETELSLELGSKDDLRELHAELTGIFAKEGAELRLALPESWTLFFKRKEGESRLLLAHPDLNSWVGSVIFDEARAAMLLNALSDRIQRAGEPLRLSELGMLTRFSNLDVVIS